MKKIFIILAVLCFVSSTAQAHDISEDILTTKNKTPLVNGKKEGVERFYDKNGTLRKEITYKNGKWNGIVKDYRSDGSLRSEISYVDNKVHGSFKDYDFDGNLMSESFWQDDVLKETCNYRHGKKEECRKVEGMDFLNKKNDSAKSQKQYKKSTQKKKSKKSSK